MKVQLPPFIKEFDKVLTGYPDAIISAILIGLGVFAILVGLYGKPSYKVALTAWYIAP
jgi:hypothetical protein